MFQYFKNNIAFLEMEKYTLEKNESIFDSILRKRSGKIDPKRFFLEYISPEFLSQYDFDDLDSLEKFSDICCSCLSPLQLMGGCNLDQKDLDRGMVYSGIKMSDPKGMIPGIFDIHEERMTYSPLFSEFYEQRDLCKFARDKYFTTIPFEDIMLKQLDMANSFYVHTGGSLDIEKNIEKISREQMFQFIKNPNEGERVRQKVLKY